MTARRRHWAAFVFTLCALVLAQGCRTSPSPGIEFGNPNLGAKSFRVVPEEGSETYAISLLDADLASVDQLTAGAEPELLDTVIVPYTLDGRALTLDATFADSRHIVVTADLSQAELIDGTLTVDGEERAACFEVPGLSPDCGNGEPEAAAGEVGASPPTARFSATPLVVSQDETPEFPEDGASPPYDGPGSAASAPKCKGGEKCWKPLPDIMVDEDPLPPPRPENTGIRRRSR